MNEKQLARLEKRLEQKKRTNERKQQRNGKKVIMLYSTRSIEREVVTV